MSRPEPLRVVQEALVALLQPKGATLRDITRYVMAECRGVLGNDPKEIGKNLRAAIKQGVQRKALVMSKTGEIKSANPTTEMCRRRRRRKGKGKGKGKKGKGRRRRRRRGKKGKKGKKGRGRRRRRRGGKKK